MNSFSCMGNVTRQPEGKQVGDQQKVVFGVAVRRAFVGKDKVDVDFFDVEVWGKTAEVVEKFVNKGSFIGVRGRLVNESWEAKDGSGKKYRTIIKAEDVTLGPKTGGQEA